MMIISDFAKRFSELIGDSSYTQVGNEIGLSKQTVSAYIKGERSPKKPTIQAISVHYGVNPLWLLGYDEPKYIEKPTTVSSDGLDPLDKQLMDFVSTLTVDQKEFLLAQLQTMNRKKKENQSSPDR